MEEGLEVVVLELPSEERMMVVVAGLGEALLEAGRVVEGVAGVVVLDGVAGVVVVALEGVVVVVLVLAGVVVVVLVLEVAVGVVVVLVLAGEVAVEEVTFVLVAVVL